MQYGFFSNVGNENGLDELGGLEVMSISVLRSCEYAFISCLVQINYAIAFSADDVILHYSILSLFLN